MGGRCGRGRGGARGKKREDKTMRRKEIPKKHNKWHNYYGRRSYDLDSSTCSVTHPLPTARLCSTFLAGGKGQLMLPCSPRRLGVTQQERRSSPAVFRANVSILPIGLLSSNNGVPAVSATICAALSGVSGCIRVRGPRLEALESVVGSEMLRSAARERCE